MSSDLPIYMLPHVQVNLYMHLEIIEEDDLSNLDWTSIFRSDKRLSDRKVNSTSFLNLLDANIDKLSFL